PATARLDGRLCRLEPIDVEKHADDLFAAFATDLDHQNWTYLPYGPFADKSAFASWMTITCLGDDPCFFAIVDRASEKVVGMASYLRIVPAQGVVEVGHIHFSPLMQGKPISTEAMYLMMKYVFDDLEYRRYEWKCDSLNGPSCAAAQRLGFAFEGIFRQALMYKQRNRDTSWYSIIDSEWPLVKQAFEVWLDPANFNMQGEQKMRLSESMRSARDSLR
ncbi:MAG: RimJ/RimL family protein N-acetyltransferase, partial [Planctomycetota bacterium]